MRRTFVFNKLDSPPGVTCFRETKDVALRRKGKKEARGRGKGKKRAEKG
jgi:hypothetical protein